MAKRKAPKEPKKPKDPYAVLGGQRLRICRKEKGWSQERLSKETGYQEGTRGVGLGTSQIANFEQGTRGIGPDEAEILARIFKKYAGPYYMGILDEQEAAVLATMRSQSKLLRKTS